MRSSTRICPRCTDARVRRHEPAKAADHIEGVLRESTHRALPSGRTTLEIKFESKVQSAHQLRMRRSDVSFHKTRPSHGRGGSDILGTIRSSKLLGKVLDLSWVQFWLHFHVVLKQKACFEPRKHLDILTSGANSEPEA